MTDAEREARDARRKDLAERCHPDHEIGALCPYLERGLHDAATRPERGFRVVNNVVIWFLPARHPREGK